MIRTTAVPRPIRVGAAAASVAGLALLAGCAGQTTSGSTDAGTSSQNPSASADAGSGASTGTYKDGTYTANGTYQTPESVEEISVTLTLADGTVTDVEVTGEPKARETRQYQGDFIGGIQDEVVGKKLDDLSVDKVGGSSLTSGGFNAAVKEIRTEAAS
ncbi:FMN-binding domain-containing protein [Microbacterium sp. LKL04]|uniref:FMN-binding protein n=1 Tax=Microbacterium oleivorans TaxID=273677 RepID=A0A4R5YFG3_9MICO|nr:MULTISPECIES: FMN-binding protein [Microbacterium]TDL43891.1 FMN-binding protein [Microbacterium oleivorans]SCY30611.1 FMN-binding domain-containing protein [Microbacterium sp. LKL04]